MAHLFPRLRLRAEERALLDAHEREVQTWLEAAKAGEVDEQNRLYTWAYLTARDYYGRKVAVERAVTVQDAEEMAVQFFLEFQRNWTRMRSVTHYTRRMLQRNLRRYLQRKRRLMKREASVSNVTLEEIVQHIPPPEQGNPWEDWSDEEWHQYQATLHVFKKCNAETQAIIAYRLKDPPPTYREIAQMMEMAEASVRMRVTRFYRAVRKRARQK